MRTITLLTASLMASATLVASSAATAATTIYTSAAAFAAATSAPGVDTYTGFNISGPTASPITRSAGAYTYLATATPPSDGSIPTGEFFGAGTNTNPWLSTTAAFSSVVFSNFAAGVAAVGGNFFGSDINGSFRTGNITLTFVSASGSTTETITNPTTSSFLGFVSTTPITSLTVTAVQGGAAGVLWPTVDNLTLARSSVVAAVPEPATWAMMLAGFGMIGFAARRRSVKTTVTYA